MCLQSILLVKGLLAKLTLKWLHWRMRTFVGIESGGESEPLATHVAFEWSFPGMAVDVRLQISFLVETFTAELAMVHTGLSNSKDSLLVLRRRRRR